ncbi:hypothetical protein SCG7086_AP_00190 [Chlamydiales bacterium SCGC AG-110-P3]|nr:hypothetical protein SCG7086_AP_00190 [Chlamydiales bacterium SCGC AG-110-P3]
MNNALQAIQWLENSQSISILDGQFVQDGFGTRFRRWLNPTYNTDLIQQVVHKIQLALPTSTFADEQKAFARIGDLCINKHQRNVRMTKQLKALDRILVQFREENPLQHTANKQALAKWERYGFRQDVFFDHPEFAEWLLSTPVASQMKVTRDDIELVEGIPALRVEGELFPFSLLQERFSVETAPAFKEKFIVDRRTRDVYTYLDNGLGLQKHHPYLATLPAPISTLSEADYQTTLDMARRHIRAEEMDLSAEERASRNEGRDFILQIVSSKVSGSDTNATTLLYQRKHPWLRVIAGRDNPDLGTKKGEVYDFGFGWKGGAAALPFMTKQGQFRILDLWNYKTPEERVVTNCAISETEVRDLFEYSSKYHRDSTNLGRHIGFNLTEQNCSVFVRYGAKIVGIKVPTEIKITALIARIAPEWMKQARRKITEVGGEIGSLLDRFTAWIPDPVKAAVTLPVKKVHAFATWIFDKCAATFLAIGRFLAGGAFGEPGRAFVQAGEESRNIEPPLWNPLRNFSLSDYKINLPAILQEWQLNQAGTVVYDRPVKLSIVPPVEQGA